MHQHALWYSTDPSVTIGQLKAGDYIFDGDSDDVQSWMTNHHVSAFVSDDTDYFYGFGLISSAPHIVYAMGDV